ncbi:hypothetical protein N7468_003746 [Penicillium chermesinum]|uniref:Uncharacterized protein n=1 Tax=Penicillium chermesinum TaxID=63820 RepID=A0A9W9P9X6_9EURO|nr:uncharacterized protein N7468_003746 [Penicillium chermesinum]KAJ5239127.1 hypothetical protein N7468_003746 [Penicillium chermesinum]
MVIAHERHAGFPRIRQEVYPHAGGVVLRLLLGREAQDPRVWVDWGNGDRPAGSALLGWSTLSESTCASLQFSSGCTSGLSVQLVPSNGSAIGVGTQGSPSKWL